MLRKKRIKKNLKKTYSKKKSIWNMAIPIKLNYTPSTNLFDRIFEESILFGETSIVIDKDKLSKGWPVEYISIKELIKRYSSCLTNEQLQQLKDLGYEAD